MVIFYCIIAGLDYEIVFSMKYIFEKFDASYIVEHNNLLFLRYWTYFLVMFYKRFGWKFEIVGKMYVEYSFVGYHC